MKEVLTGCLKVPAISNTEVNGGQIQQHTTMMIGPLHRRCTLCAAGLQLTGKARKLKHPEKLGDKAQTMAVYPVGLLEQAAAGGRREDRELQDQLQGRTHSWAA